MKQILILSYGFFNKLLSLAENLEKDSQRIAGLINSVRSEDQAIIDSLRKNTEILLSINCRAQRIREELANAAISQCEVFNDESRFESSAHEIIMDFKKINEICDEIVRPSYFINAEGRLIR